MLFSYPAILQVFFLLISIFFAAVFLILIAPFGLSLNIEKKENLVWGSIELTWLFLTIIKRNVPHQSIEELLASIGREKDGMDGMNENEGKEGTDGNEGNGDGESQEQREAEKLSTACESTINGTTDSTTDGRTDGRMAEKTEASRKASRPPGLKSLINAAPALAELIGDLGRSIRIKKFSCRLCFGLNDPAQTAIISGYIWFFASLFGVSLADLVIEPWFDGLRLEGKLDAEIRARLISPIWAGFKSLRRKQIRQLAREMLGWR